MYRGVVLQFLYNMHERNELVERVYAFTDESGAFGWDIENPNVSTHFIITAIIVKGPDLEGFTQKSIFKQVKLNQAILAAIMHADFAY